LCDISKTSFILLGLECTDSIIASLDQNVSKYAKSFFEKNLKIINSSTEERKIHTDKKTQYYKPQIIIRCIELFSTLIERLNNDSLQYIDPEQCFYLLHGHLEDQDFTIRQNSLSLAYQIAKSCPSLLNNSVHNLAESLIRNLEPTQNNADDSFESCRHNAVLAIGEFAITYRENFQKYLPHCAGIISQILASNRIYRGIGQTLSVTIGQIALVEPDIVAPILGSFLKNFCLNVVAIRVHDDSTRQASMGILQAMLKNLQAVSDNLLHVCNFLVHLERESQELNNLARQVLSEFIDLAGKNWYAFYENLPMHIKQTLKERFIQ